MTKVSLTFCYMMPKNVKFLFLIQISDNMYFVIIGLYNESLILKYDLNVLHDKWVHLILKVF